MRVLVTGAAGFIGSHLTEALLASGANVRALAQYNSRNDWGFLADAVEKKAPGLEVVTGDVRDAHHMAAVCKGVDAVYHLAALIPIPYSYAAPMSFAATNVLGTLHTLEAARAAGVKKFIQVSTSEVYGTARQVPMSESHPLQAQSPYAASKIGADQTALSYWHSFKLPVNVIRPFNTFGPRQSARAVIPTILVGLLSGKKELRLGDTRPVRDFTFVADTVRGLIAGAKAAPGQVVHLGTGRGVSIGEVARLCAQACGLPPPRIVTESQRRRPAASEVMRLISNNGQARRALKWSPKTSLEEGLRLTADYIRGHLDQYKADIYNI